MNAPAAFRKALEAVDEADFTSYIFQYPPMAVWQPAPDPAWVEAGWKRTAARGGALGLYVHVPFCATKCTFCRFYVVESNAVLDRRRWVEGLAAEAKRWGKVIGKAPFSTLYFGGGTPSMLEPELIRAAFASLRGAFSFTPDCQVSFEANPSFIDEAKIKALKDSGVDRLTIGVQSLDDKVTATVERTQDNADVARVYRLAREAIPYINIDLMTGLPGQSLASFRRTLEEVVSWRPDMVHLNPFLPTRFTRFAQRGGRMLAADNARSLRQQRLAAEALNRAGYRRIRHDALGLHDAARNRQLEDSNVFGRPFLGLGPGAVSCAPGESRHVNLPNPAAWRTAAQEGKLPVFKACRLRPEDMRIDGALNRLWHGGLDAAEFRAAFGLGPQEAFPGVFESLEASGVLARADGDSWRVSADQARARFELRRALYEPSVVSAVLS